MEKVLVRVQDGVPQTGTISRRQCLLLQHAHICVDVTLCICQSVLSISSTQYRLIEHREGIFIGKQEQLDGLTKMPLSLEPMLRRIRWPRCYDKMMMENMSCILCDGVLYRTG